MTFSQNAAPALVSKELTYAVSCARRSTHSIAILAMPDRLVIITIVTIPFHRRYVILIATIAIEIQ